MYVHHLGIDFNYFLKVVCWECGSMVKYLPCIYMIWSSIPTPQKQKKSPWNLLIFSLLFCFLFYYFSLLTWGLICYLTLVVLRIELRALWMPGKQSITQSYPQSNMQRSWVSSVGNWTQATQFSFLFKVYCGLKYVTQLIWGQKEKWPSSLLYLEVGLPLTKQINKFYILSTEK